MTTHKEALTLTLAALKQIDEAMPFPVAKLAIKKAEEALAQPEQEPTNLERHERNVQQLFGTPQPKEPEQEPVAWGNLANWCLDSDRVLITDKDEAAKYHRDVYDLTPLYTTPPQRKPLTDEQIDSVWKEYRDILGGWDYGGTEVITEGTFENAVRAIEAAHGIKE